MELVAEYIGRDGQRQQLRVSCEAPAGADPLQGLLSGVAQMRERVVELLGPLVSGDAQDPAAAGQDLNGDDEDDAEDERNIDNRTNSDGPPAKRPRSLS
ncbi:PREDICTED: uncharacterized protein C14orf142 homolog [Elephantulus edwardii]|uniref:uncharacterized protein C14orf142 homolog n=1 Tax=Elephantulus edwardii TaxID=28737 RepID=UPI0003F07884|nr:PREDICTED: uncharacterized protein C14orf142 homolog [Elephantulus edwardii]